MQLASHARPSRCGVNRGLSRANDLHNSAARMTGNSDGEALEMESNGGFSATIVTRVSRRGAFVLIVAALGSAPLANAQAQFTVGWFDERLTVRASAAPLGDVVAEVARLTGLKVIGADKLQGPITVDFADLAEIEALKALLTDVNYFVQREAEAAKGEVGLVLRVHSMARAGAPTFEAPGLRVPAIDAILESEEEDLTEEKEEEIDDPDVDQENKENLQAAQQLVLNGAFEKSVPVSALRRHMKSPNPEIRLEATKALAQRPITLSLTPLVEALADDAISVRRAAIDALSHANDSESLKRVGLVLEKDPEPQARYGALRIFAIRADDASIPHLQKVVNDDDLLLREGAAQMLAEFEQIARAKKAKQPPD
jgi:HEAT repeat protein